MPEPVVECPSCAHPMHPATGREDPTWLCDECGDFFMPRKDFQKLVGVTIAGRAQPGPGEGGHACPGCHGAMAGVVVKGADIDVCPKCDIVVSDRSSFSFIIEHTPAKQAPGRALLAMDVARNVSTAYMAGSVPGLGVENLFVLYRNGILITSYAPGVPKELDRDIVGSMLMAVTEFVQTSFKGLGGSAPLSSIRFGDREIAFEHGDFLVLALTLKGILGPETRKGLAAALREIEAQNDHLLRSWDGDLGAFGGMLEVFERLLGPLRAGA